MLITQIALPLHATTINQMQIVEYLNIFGARKNSTRHSAADTRRVAHKHNTYDGNLELDVRVAHIRTVVRRRTRRWSRRS